MNHIKLLSLIEGSAKKEIRGIIDVNQNQKMQKLKEMLPTLAVRYICLFFISFLSFTTPRKSSRIFSRLLIEFY